MTLTARQIAEHVCGSVVGDPDVVITGIAGIKEAQPGDLTFVANPKYVPQARGTKASVIVVGRDWKTALPQTLIRVENPSLGFAQACGLLADPSRVKFAPGISPRAAVSPRAVLGRNVSVQPFAVIEDGAVVGDRTVVGSGVYVGHETRIGSDCLLHANASIRERCVLGNRVIVHHGASIGSDGYGYATVNGVHHKIPQIGTVEIGDDVEIGACTTVDRGRFGKTVIGRGTKIDNLVQIGHNVAIGEHCLIVAQAGISGSVRIGNNVIIAGQAGIVGHIRIGDNAVIMAQSGVTGNVPEGCHVLGSPALPEHDAKRVMLSSMRLPGLLKRVRHLEHQSTRTRSSGGRRTTKR